MEVDPTYNIEQTNKNILHMLNATVELNTSIRFNKKKCDTKTDKNKKHKKRCALPLCKKKLKLTDYECRCHRIYCQKHRLPEMHECSIDYKLLNHDSFIEKAGLIACIPEKLRSI